MRQLFFMLLALGLVAGSTLAQEDGAKPAEKKEETKKEEPKPDPAELKKKASYAIGWNIGQDFQRNGIDLDPAQLAAGLKDALEKAKPKMTDEEIQVTMQAFQKLLMAERDAKAKQEAQAGLDHLAANKKKEGVTSTKSGLQYEVLKKGDGPKPKATDVVKVHYHGTLVNGDVFDSSVERKMPATFPVNGVIQGWVEALQLMPVGSKWKLTIPSELAYGERGSRGGIGPNQVLIFEVELLEIVTPPGQEKKPEDK